MSNAILIIDMPKDCPQCPVAHYNKLDEFTGCDIVGGKKYAITTEKGYKDTNYRPSWCPLKPMPEKYSIGDNDYIDGWNSCIDELVGEKENE